MLNMCKQAAKLPQPGMLLPSHTGGVNSFKQHIWTGVSLCDLGQQADPYTKTMLITRKC